MITIIVVAAGSGSRFGSAVPKQFLQIEGRPVVMRAVDALRRAVPDARLIIVLATSEIERWRYLCNLHHFDSPTVVAGGDTRWASVKNAVEFIAADPGDIVMVHDGARPFPTTAMLNVLVGAFGNGRADGAVPVVPVTDSLRRLTGGGPASEPVDRTMLRAVQTPQAFRGHILVEAYRRPWRPEFTDDASVVQDAGFGNIILTTGDPLNIKITNPLDIAVAETILGAVEL